MKNEWQPIETAPKDGTEILAFADNDGVHVFHVAFYDHSLWRGSTGEGSESWIWEKLTHWMPLPKPPEETK